MGRRTTKELRNPKRLAAKLAAIRHYLQLSQSELISRLGFADELVREEISAFERGVRVPPVVVLLGYARAVGVSVETLIDDQLELPPPLVEKALSGATAGRAPRSKIKGRIRRLPDHNKDGT